MDYCSLKFKSLAAIPRDSTFKLWCSEMVAPNIKSSACFNLSARAKQPVPNTQYSKPVIQVTCITDLPQGMHDLTNLPVPQKITVLLVDDHALVRRGFRRILEDETHISVIGEAADGAGAVKMAIELRPSVILMDFALPDMNGLEATKKILKSSPHSAVLMLSMHSEEFWVREAADAGARGYLLKNVTDVDLGSAVTQIAAGELLFDHGVLKSATKNSREHRLSTRQLQILQMIVDGKSNKEIAVQLNLSTNTVGAHRANIMRALAVGNTAELVTMAIRRKLVNLS
jgi:DNA-binding NarL/FixJ family response regulator